MVTINYHCVEHSENTQPTEKKSISCFLYYCPFSVFENANRWALWSIHILYYRRMCVSNCAHNLRRGRYRIEKVCGHPVKSIAPGHGTVATWRIYPGTTPVRRWRPEGRVFVEKISIALRTYMVRSLFEFSIKKNASYRGRTSKRAAYRLFPKKLKRFTRWVSRINYYCNGQVKSKKKMTSSNNNMFLLVYVSQLKFSKKKNTDTELFTHL